MPSISEKVSFTHTYEKPKKRQKRPSVSMTILLHQAIGQWTEQVEFESFGIPGFPLEQDKPDLNFGWVSHKKLSDDKGTFKTRLYLTTREATEYVASVYRSSCELTGTYEVQDGEDENPTVSLTFNSMTWEAFDDDKEDEDEDEDGDD